MSVVTERFNRTLKNKTFKYTTSVPKMFMLINQMKQLINIIIHSTIKMKPSDVKVNTHIDSSKEIDSKDPKFKVSDTVQVS